jgi:hypothetical protein
MKKTYLDLEWLKLGGGCINQLFQVLIEVLEHKRQFFISVKNIDQSDNVWVLKLLKKSNLTDGSRRNSLLLSLQLDLLKSKDLTTDRVSGFVHNTVGAFTDDL